MERFGYLLFPIICWLYITAMAGALLRSLTPWQSYGPTPLTRVNILLGAIIEILVGYVIYWLIVHLHISVQVV